MMLLSSYRCQHANTAAAEEAVAGLIHRPVSETASRKDRYRG